MYLESNNQMPLVTREKKTCLICFDEQTITREEDTLFAYEAVRVPFPYTYAIIVAAIIKEKYNDDAREAIVNNHLEENPSEEHEQEFAQLQAWRSHAKQIAHQICD